MYNYILIILYGISDIFSPKKFALLRKLTSIFKKTSSQFIKRIENLEVETIHTATNTPEMFNLSTCTVEYRMQKRN